MNSEEVISFIRQFRKPKVTVWLEPGEPQVAIEILEEYYKQWNYYNLEHFRFQWQIDFCGFKLPSQLEINLRNLKASITTNEKGFSEIYSKIILEIEEVLSNKIDHRMLNAAVIKSLYVCKNTDSRDLIRPEAKILDADFYEMFHHFHSILYDRMNNLKESLIRLESIETKLPQYFENTRLSVLHLNVDPKVLYPKNVSRLYDFLNNEGFISKPSTKKAFNQLFIGPRVDEQVIWSAKVGSLHYLFRQLEKKGFTRDSGSGKWKLIWNSFLSEKTGQKFNYSSVSKYADKDISKIQRRKIDDILNKIQLTRISGN